MSELKPEHQEIAAIVDDYRRSFAEVDMEIFKADWDREFEDLIYVPQERAEPLHGWTDLERYFEEVQRAFDRVSVMDIADLSIDVRADSAYAFFTYHFEGMTAEQPEPFVVDGRVTLIMRRQSPKWLVVHCHGSAPGPY